MKKSAALLILIFAFALLSGCTCEHVWSDADCDTPKACAECGETEGAPAGHSWTDATCTAPKTCTVCAATEGEAADHVWTDATTEAPKTCTLCGATEGNRIITDPRFSTAKASHLFGTWMGTYTMTDDESLSGFKIEMKVELRMELTPDARFTINYRQIDVEAFNEGLVEYMTQDIYSQLAADGLSPEEVDEVMIQIYGLNTRDYFRYVVAEMDFTGVLENMSGEGVYFVDGNTLYLGSDWETMEENTYRLEGDTMSIQGMLKDDSEVMTVKKVG